MSKQEELESGMYVRAIKGSLGDVGDGRSPEREGSNYIIVGQ
jgi:hypothetical protein